MSIRVIALDLEGTLISNAMSQIPRPRLSQFLEACQALVGRVVMFTTVEEPLFRRIATQLFQEHHAPHWFAEIEYIARDGETKNLALIPECTPDAALLVDDFEIYVHPGQETQWIQAPFFDAPYPSDDRGLTLTLGQILERVLLPRPLGILQLTFAKMMAHFNHILPEENVLHRRRGRIGDPEDGDYGYGDSVYYLFGQDERGEYVDFYLLHRIAGDWHGRIWEDGSTENLDVTSPFGPRVTGDPEVDAQLRAEDEAEYDRVRAMLKAKGFPSCY